MPALKDEKLFTDFDGADIDGNHQNFEKYQGRVSIVVNVASEWGLAAAHYSQLQSYYEKYEQDGLSIVAFPCNQFGSQEPLTNGEIKMNVEALYGITFDMMSKIDVNGPSEIPLYSWLKSSPAGANEIIQWNFTKFVIDRCGRVHSRHEPVDEPISWEDELVQLLNDHSPCE